jgi:hypothetical protein
MPGLLNPTYAELKAYNEGGFRERFAMEHGQRHTFWSVARQAVMWMYKYSSKEEYQDGNGAQYDFTHERWVN